MTDDQAVRIDRTNDLLTVVAIGVVAYALANILHESVGHGGACIALGGRPQVVSSVHFECGEEQISDAARRMVSAAGTIVNFLAAAVSLLAMKRQGLHRPHLAWFLWLFTTINLLMGAGYFLFSGIGNIGDWSSVFSGLLPAWVWRPLLALIGAALYFYFARLSARRLIVLVGSGEAAVPRAKSFAVPVYIAGGLLYCISGLFNPVGPVLIAISAAAASFGGTSGLLWLTEFVRRGSDSHPPVAVSRSVPWIIAGVIASILFVGVLGPAVRLG
ncbi:MAG: hypothetical protein ABI718_01375 [Acidobacteriota bacterium]